MYSVNASKKTEKLKKLYVVDVDQKTEKLKKAYVVGADKKLVKLWSSFTPRFVSASRTRLFHSVDGKTWEAQEIPWDTSYLGTSTQPWPTMGMTYGLGKYWLAHGKYLCSSEDGVTWNIVKTTSVSNPYRYSGFCKVFFLNNEIVAYEKTNSAPYTVLHITSDGKNWSTIEFIDGVSIRDMCYGNHMGKNVYFWLINESYNVKVYISETLNGTRTNIITEFGGCQDSEKYYTQMIIANDGKLYLQGKGSDYWVRKYDLSTGELKFANLGYSSFPYIMLGSTDLEVFAYQYNKFKYEKFGADDVGSYETGLYYAASGACNLHPPHNEDGLISFVIQSSSADGVDASYKPRGASAFTKVTNVAEYIANDEFVATYATDGGGWS